MARENEFYRDNLEQILQFTQGRQMLTVAEVCRFTGLADSRTVRKHFPFVGTRISAATLARCMSGGAAK